MDFDEIVSIGHGSREIMIPSEQTVIRAEEFASLPVEYVDIPENITIIQDMAFWGNDSLEELRMTDSVTLIGKRAFQDCRHLRKVTFVNQKKSGNTVIDRSAFLGCKELKEVILSDVVSDIGQNAFSLCGSLEEIFIPASVTHIGKYAFVRCPSLKRIIVDENNPAYASRDGVLYDKSLETLLCWPAGKEDFQIPAHVTGIEAGACIGQKIEKLVIPENVTRIGTQAFAECKNLKEVIIQGTLTRLERQAFETVQASVNFTIDGISFSSFYNRQDEYFQLILEKKYSFYSSRAIGLIEQASYIMLQMLFKHPEDIQIQKLILKYDNFTHCFDILTEHQRTDIMQVFQDVFHFITEDNIDSLILYAINRKKYDAQLFLMDYKKRYIGYKSTEEIIRKKFKL